MTFLLILLACSICSFLMTFVSIKILSRANVLDEPLRRSSHSKPVPRGGGLAMFFSFALCILLLAYFDYLLGSLVFLLLTAIGFITLVAFWDDCVGLSARFRFMVQSIVVIFLCLNLLDLSFFIDLNAFLFLVSVTVIFLSLVWLINLYNFMDGINGLASLEACFVFILAGVIHLIDGSIEVATICFLCFSAVSGFVPFNYPIAKVFMGDAGSYFIGMCLVAVILLSITENINLIGVWLLLLGFFIVDATFTLFRRIFKGKKFYEPHKSHLYQKFATKFQSHTYATLVIMGLNIAWFAPWAALYYLDITGIYLSLFICYTPILTLSILYESGVD